MTYKYKKKGSPSIGTPKWNAMQEFLQTGIIIQRQFYMAKYEDNFNEMWNALESLYIHFRNEVPKKWHEELDKQYKDLSKATLKNQLIGVIPKKNKYRQELIKFMLKLNESIHDSGLFAMYLPTDIAAVGL